MRGFHFDRILAGTALALVLTLSGQAQSQSNSSSIDAAVPVPEAADVPPPTAADIAKSTPTITPGPQASAICRGCAAWSRAIWWLTWWPLSAR